MRLCSVEDRVPSARLKYKLASESVEYRKASGKRLENHRTAEVGRSGHHLIQHRVPSRLSQGCCLGLWSSWVLGINKEEDSLTLLKNLCQYLTTLS